jgi:hypothetical protein
MATELQLAEQGQFRQFISRFWTMHIIMAVETESQLAEHAGAIHFPHAVDRTKFASYIL